MNRYAILNDEELVSAKNKMVRDLNEILQETTARKLDTLCDCQVKVIIRKHPAIDLKGDD